MRKLMWFTVGFAVACSVAFSIYLQLWVWLITLLLLGTGLALWRVSTKKCRITALILLGAAAGFLWVYGYQQLYWNAAREVDGKVLKGSITVYDYSFPVSSGVGADGYIKLGGKDYKIRFYWTTEETLEPGDRVTGSLMIRLTSAGGKKDPTHHSADGILLLGYLGEDAVLEKNAASSWIHFPSRLRREIVQRIDAVFPGDVAGFARALLIGDTGALDYAQDVSMRISGIRHVVAVSGLHVSILFALAYTLAGKRRILTAILGIPLLMLFAAVAGFSASVVRACLMQIIMILALLLNKEYDPPTALATAVLSMLLWNPLLITSVSLQLSVGCIIGIFLLCRRIHDRLLRGKLKKLAKGKRLTARILRWTVASVSVSISAAVVTMPLVAYHFGAVSIVSILTNALTLWAITFIFYGIGMTCILSLLSTAVATATAWLSAWLIRYVLLVAGMLSRIPFAAVYTCSIYIVIWLVLTYVLLIAFFMSRKKHPAVYTACVIAGLVLAIIAGWTERLVRPVQATVLDVGQGQCVILYTDSGAYMVDCGGEYAESVTGSAVELLLSMGIYRLDGLILTHYDTDHSNGVEYLLSRFPVEQLYLPDIPDSGGVRQMLENDFSDRITWVREERCVEDGNARFSIYPGLDRKIANESCLSILFQRGNCDILITGDLTVEAETLLLDTYPIPDLEILVAGHHGSDSSTGKRLLEETAPEQVAISVGQDNRFGHPDRLVTERLKYYGCRIWRTDLDGTIHFRR